MKRILFFVLFGMLFQTVIAQSEAGAIFLLISPGARAGGMGETHAAVSNDAYASYWNPAGLAFPMDKPSEIAMMHVNWLPGLADDIYYEFLAGRHHVPNLGTLGGHMIYLNLGEQVHTDENGEHLGKFRSFMVAANASYANMLNKKSAFGLNLKLIHIKLADRGVTVGSEQGNPWTTSFLFDIGYMKKGISNGLLDFGATIQNVGQKISFIDVEQADPAPTNLKIGFNLHLFQSEYNKVSFAYDVNKMLVASYPDRDLNGDGDALDENEPAHADPWYFGLLTSWVDDWFLLHDSKTDGLGPEDEDGNTEDGTFKNEIDELIHNFGVEYWYASIFAVRAGLIYDKIGKITAPTFGIGLRLFDYGLDFGYISGPEGHPLTNTMRFSLNAAF